MLRASRMLALPMIAMGLLLVVNATEAQAQRVRVQIGGFGLNGGGVYRAGHYFPSNRSYYSARRLNYGSHHYGHHSFYSPGIHSYGRYGGHGFYHDTSRLDYHAPQIYRHGNHWDYQPGHYYIHRSGHYHH